MNRRVALCLSGIVGGTKGPDGYGDLVDMKTIYNQYNKHILNKNNVDVFIHSWSVDAEDEITNLYKPKSKSFEKQIDFRDVNKGKHKNRGEVQMKLEMMIRIKMKVKRIRIRIRIRISYK